MAAAGAAPARKSAGRAGATKAPSSLPEWFLEEQPSWVPIGRDLLRNVFRTCKPLEQRIMFAIADATIGDWENGFPQWGRVRYEDIREFGNEVSDVAIAKSLDSLLEPEVDEQTGEILRKPLIDRKQGKFRILYRNLQKAARREARKLERIPTSAKPGERYSVSYGSPALITPPEPATAIKVSVRKPNGDIRVDSEFAFKGGCVEIDLVEVFTEGRKDSSEAAENLTRVKSSGPGARPQAKIKRIDEGPENLTRVKYVGEVIEPLFVQLFEKDLDAALLARIAERLGDAPPEALVLRIRARYKPGMKSGLIVDLADDARKAWEARGKHGIGAPYANSRQAESAPVKPFDAEPEGTGTPWALIRSAFRKKITPQEYENWIARTRWVSHERGLLTVAVPDDVTAEFNTLEWHDQLIAVGKDLGFTFATIKFEVAP